MRKALAALALSLTFWACPGPKPPTPTPSPNPTPTPPVVKYENLLLRQSEGRLSRGGQPHLVFGFIPCWDGEEVDHGGWPGIDSSMMDYALGYGADMFHIRVGPAVKDDRWPTGLNYGMGPYVNDDYTQGFNQPWWERAVAQVDRAGSKGANVQVSIIDGWGCKHASWGDWTLPWAQADIEACTNHITPEQEKWIRKTVSEFGCYANVIWEDGNEPGVSGRYKPAWTLDMQRIVRDEEQKSGCGVVHMFGTNSGNDEVEADSRIDYTATHSRSGIDGPHFGKWRINNERNPYFTPTQEHQLYCAARNTGQAWFFWRGGMGKEAMDDTLSLWASGCDGMGGGGCPFDVPPPTEIGCKPHGTMDGKELWDCTPLVSDARYCRSIGSDRPRCPYRLEGDPFRFECELKGLGGTPSYSVSGGSLKLEPRRGNPFQFLLSGSGTGLITCTSPSTGSVNICRREGQTIVVTR